MELIPFYWLAAIASHPETILTDVSVAEALLTGSGNDIPGIDQEDADESVQVLIELGFAESVVSMDCPDCEGCVSHLLALRMPQAVSV